MRPIRVWRRWKATVEHPDGPDCTGVGASWCPQHGNCTCPRHLDGERYEGEHGCPLHG